MAVHPLPPRRTSAPETPDPPAYDRRRAWLILAMVVAFMMINYADKSVLGLAAVPLMDELAIDKSTYGLISSSFYVLFSVSGLVVGLLSARWSTRTMLLVMAALWAVAQLPALVATVPALVAGRLLLGAAEGPAASMSMHTLYGWFPPGRRGMPSALQIGGAALGTAVAAPVLTWFIVNLGWRSAFVALAIISAAWCLVWYAVGKDGPYSAAAHRAAAGAAPASGAPGPRGRRAERHPAHGRGAGASAVPAARQRDRRGQRPQRLRFPLGAGGLQCLAAGLSADPARSDRVDRVGRRQRGLGAQPAPAAVRPGPRRPAQTARPGRPRRRRDRPGAAVLVSGAALALLPFAEQRAAQLALVAVAFAAHAVAIPLHYVTTAAVVPAARRGPVFGVVAATGTLPGMFVPYLTGHLVDGAASEATGYAIAFLLSAAVMAVCGAVAMLAIRPDRDARALGGEG